MLLFGKKFSPKSAPPRKSASISEVHRQLDPVQSQNEFGLDYGPLKLKLDDQESVFENGRWIPADRASPSNSPQNILQLKKQNEQLREENSLLKLKVEILLDMLTETTAEVHLQENEIEELKEKLRLQNSAQ